MRRTRNGTHTDEIWESEWPTGERVDIMKRPGDEGVNDIGETNSAKVSRLKQKVNK